MLNRRKLLALTMALSLVFSLAMSTMFVKATTTNSIEINLTDPNALGKYFDIPASNLGTWIIENGVLKQTTPMVDDALALGSNRGVNANVLPTDSKAFVSIKGQNLRDYTLEFSTINQKLIQLNADKAINPNDPFAVVVGGTYARVMGVAFNVGDASKYALQEDGTNNGMTLFAADPVSFSSAAATTKLWNLFDNSKAIPTDPLLRYVTRFPYTAAFGDPKAPNMLNNNVNNQAAGGFNLLMNYPTGTPGTFNKPGAFEVAGKHYYKIVKTGNTYTLWTKTPVAESEDHSTLTSLPYNNELRKQGKNGTSHTGITFFHEDWVKFGEWTDADGKYANGGAIQFVALNGKVEYSDIKLTSDQLDVSKFVTDINLDATGTVAGSKALIPAGVDATSITIDKITDLTTLTTTVATKGTAKLGLDINLFNGTTKLTSTTLGVRVTIPVANLGFTFETGKTYEIYNYHNGQLVKIDHSIVNGSLILSNLTKFSPFVVVQLATPVTPVTPNVQTGDNTPFALFILITLALSAFVITLKKRCK